MLNKLKIEWLLASVIQIIFFTNLFASAKNLTSEIDSLENFDDGEVELLSYPGQDYSPNSWQLSNNNTHANSPFSLWLYGNTWKIEPISPDTISEKSVWQVSAFVGQLSEIQGFGVKDSAHFMLYAFSGSEEVNPENWVPDYQGAFPENQWNDYQLPIASDWLERFGYLPIIDGIVFINDHDASFSGNIYFDEILDITNILPISPKVEIEFTKGKIYNNKLGQKSVDIHFTSNITDEDSYFHNYSWNFGDDSTSSEQNPTHTFLVEDDHQYSVFLKVTDNTNRLGTDIIKISVDEGETSFPIKMNFVGDVMFARRIEELINQNGIEPIFNPTMELLGNSAEITFANLECPLTNQGEPHPTKSVVFRASPTTVSGLSYAGIDAVTLANNHTIDYGLEGLLQTQQVLENEDIFHFGAGENSYEAEKPLFITKNGINFGIIGASDRTGQYNNAQPFLNSGYNKPGFANLTSFNIINLINSVREVSDYVIFQIHSGSEYAQIPYNLEYSDSFIEEENYSPEDRFPSQKNIELRHQAIDAGADLVISHHPHIIQGFEVYSGKLIAHSLGNFVFDLDYPETFPTAILNAEITEIGFSKFVIQPIYIDNYIPVQAKGELGLFLLDDLAQKSKDLNTYLNIDKENITAEIIMDTNTIKRESEQFSESTQLVEENGEWISKPIKLTKSASISEISTITPRRNWQFRLGRELIWFGNFEEEGSTNWEINESSEMYDEEEIFRGNRAFKQIRNTNSYPISTNFENFIKIYSTLSEYTLYSYIKTENANNAGVEIQFFDTRYNTYPLGSENLGTTIDGSSNWKFYSNNFTLPEFTNFIDILMKSDAPSISQGKAWFDDLGLIEWTNWGNFENSEQIDFPNDFYWIQIKAEEEITSAQISYKETRFSKITSIEEDGNNEISTKFVLFQNYPNPFNPSTKIRFSIPTKSTNLQCKLIIYNTLGQQISVLLNKPLSAGNYEVPFNGTDLASGVYFYQLQIGNQFHQVKKMILLK